MSKESGMSFMSMSKHGMVMLLLVIASIPLTAKAACTFVGQGKIERITINPGKTTLPVPRDGSSLFISAPVRPPTGTQFDCSTTESIGLSNSIGTTPPARSINMPIGTTGLFWRLRATTPTVTTPTPIPSFGTSSVQAGTRTTIQNDSYAWELVATRQVVAGTVIPAGIYGTWRAGTLDLVEIRLANAITIIPSTCVTPDIPVEMPPYRVSDFPGSGSGAATRSRKGFSLKINNCPEEVKAVRYRFDVDNSKIVDGTNGVIRLDNPDAVATAKGIGLQLRDSAGAAVKFNEFTTFSGFVRAAEGTTRSHEVNFDAGYFKTGMAAVTPGSANATITFTMLYQ